MFTECDQEDDIVHLEMTQPFIPDLHTSLLQLDSCPVRVKPVTDTSHVSQTSDPGEGCSKYLDMGYRRYPGSPALHLDDKVKKPSQCQTSSSDECRASQTSVSSTQSQDERKLPDEQMFVSDETPSKTPEDAADSQEIPDNGVVSTQHSLGLLR